MPRKKKLSEIQSAQKQLKSQKIKKTADKIQTKLSFTDWKNRKIPIDSILEIGDLWKLKKGRNELTIISHNGIKKIADAAGIDTDVDYQVLIQPKYDNNYELVMLAKIKDKAGRTTTEVGEANRSNLGSRGRQNPANMAQKRAYDRAVMRHLSITGILSEDELQDEEQQDIMEALSLDEQKAIAPILNNILLAKGKEDLAAFNGLMKTEKEKFNEKQLDYLRKMWKKKYAELTEDGF